MRSRKSLIQILILAVCLIHAGAAFGSGLVEFPNKAGKAGALRVSGPGGFELSQSFKAGGNASLSLFDQAGNHLQDGTYNWEMTFQGEASGDRDAHHARAEPTSGTFTIRDGAVVNRNAVEGGFNKDQVILDDLIVDGSACIGMDCVNGE
ncbi:MAG: hypothetical protein GY953_50805, partial [bacterium]|nr:hypothetical protein [bacterium]